MRDVRKLPNFNRYPMLWLAASFAAGILSASSADFRLTASLVVCIVFALFSLFFRVRRFAAVLMFSAFAAAGAASARIETLLVAPDRVSVLYDSGTIRSGDPVEVEGVLLGRPEQSIDGVFLNLRSDKLRYRGSERIVSGNVRLFLPAAGDGSDADGTGDHGDPDPVTGDETANPKFDISDLKYGSRIRAVCKLKREDEFLDPGVIPRKEILNRLGVDATGSIKSPMLVEKIADESVFLPLAWVYDQRSNLISGFRSGLSRNAAGIMIASMLGDKYFLDKDTGDLFREGGTFHILVISGLHITVIGGLILLFLRLFTRARFVQFIVTVSVLWAYTLAVGADVPVVRAAVMVTVVLYSHVIYRQGSMLNSLGVCGLILLVWRPSDLYNPSLQLTFVSVAAIVVFAFPLIEILRRIGSWEPTAQEPFPPLVPSRLKRFCETIYWNQEGWEIRSRRQVWTARPFKSPFWPNRVKGVIQKILRYIFEGLTVSLIVQVCMLPVMVVYFHRVSAASVFLNLWVSLFIALESFAAVIAVLAAQFSSLLAAPFFAFAEASNWMMLAVPRLLSENTWASFRLAAYSGGGRAVYFLYFLPLLFLAYAVNRWNPFSVRKGDRTLNQRYIYAFATVLALGICVITFHPFSAPRPDGRLHFDFLDVGQGNSAFVTFPDGKTLLIDGGGRFSYETNKVIEDEPFEPDIRGVGEAVVSEFLWNRGYSRIDHIMATHADADHIQGLTDVAKNFQIGSAEFGRTPMGDADFAALSGVLLRNGVPVDTLARGDRLKFGDVTVEVLNPIATEDPNMVSDNNHSVVLRIIMGSRVFLLTGDVERPAETELVTGGADLPADLIEVSHHGSRSGSSEEFVDIVGAKYAIISVGRFSPFGHPNREVVERWRASGAAVMTTGERGTISVSTDGKDLKIATFQE